MFHELWVIYLAAVAVLVLMLAWIVRNKLRMPTVFACIILITSPLLVPYAVETASDDAQQLAPAWMVAIFESIQGNSEVAVAAIRSVILVECAILVVILLWVYLIRRFRSSRN